MFFEHRTGLRPQKLFGEIRKTEMSDTSRRIYIITLRPEPKN